MKLTYETTDLSKYGMQIITIWLVTDEDVHDTHFWRFFWQRNEVILI